MNHVRAVLYGTLSGRIWMPVIECTKEVSVDLTRERERLTPSRAGSLRYMVGSICADGDFRGALLTDDSFIELTRWSTNKSGHTVKRCKQIPLTAFKCIEDYVQEAV